MAKKYIILGTVDIVKNVLKRGFNFLVNEFFFFLYINYIIHSKIKGDNHQVPKIVRVPRYKINPKKIRLKIYK